MTEQNAIAFIVEKLTKFPDVKFENTNDSELKIYKRNESGFDVLLQTDERQHTLHFGTFHWHFNNNEAGTNEMLNQLAFGLTGMARLKELSKNGKAYKWLLQVENDNGNWASIETMALLNFNFWTKAEVRYLQNDLLPKSKIEGELNSA